MQGTVHLFIGNRTPSCKITFTPTWITHRVYKGNIVLCFQYLGWLLLASFSCVAMTKVASSPLHSYIERCYGVEAPAILGYQWLNMFMRTFGRRRPPTAATVGFCNIGAFWGDQCTFRRCVAYFLTPPAECEDLVTSWPSHHILFIKSEIYGGALGSENIAIHVAGYYLGRMIDRRASLDFHWLCS